MSDSSVFLACCGAAAHNLGAAAAAGDDRRVRALLAEGAANDLHAGVREGEPSAEEAVWLLFTAACRKCLASTAAQVADVFGLAKTPSAAAARLCAVVAGVDGRLDTARWLADRAGLGHSDWTDVWQVYNRCIKRAVERGDESAAEWLASRAIILDNRLRIAEIVSGHADIQYSA